MSDPEPLAWIDGRILPASDACIPLLDRGHLLGDGLFETLRSHGGQLFRLDLHVERLRRGLPLLGLSPDLADEAGRAALELAQAATARLGKDLYVRVQVTTGVGESFIGSPGRSAVTAFARPLAPGFRNPTTAGVKLMITPWVKDSRSPFALAKTLSFLPSVAARRAAAAAGADEALFLNEAGRVCEATTSNIFAVRDGTVYSPGPQEGALEGVTRATLIEAARGQGLEVVERLSMPELVGATEVFLTSTIAGVVPVYSLQGHATSWGKTAGRVTRALASAYQESWGGSGRAHPLRTGQNS